MIGIPLFILSLLLLSFFLFVRTLDKQGHFDKKELCEDQKTER